MDEAPPRAPGRGHAGGRRVISRETDSPDGWNESDWRDFQWFGVCGCGRPRRQRFVRGARGRLLDVIARCDAGHETGLAEIDRQA